MSSPFCPYAPKHIREVIDRDIEEGITYLGPEGITGVIKRRDPGGMVQFENSSKTQWYPRHLLMRMPDLEEIA